MKKHTLKALAACFFMAFGLFERAFAQEEGAAAAMQSNPVAVPTSHDIVPASPPAAAPAPAASVEHARPSAPALPALPPLGAIRALPGQSVHAGSTTAPLLSPGVPADPVGVQAPAASAPGAITRNHAIYKQIGPDGTMSYSDHRIAGASVLRKSDSYRVMRDPDAISHTRALGPNRLEVAAPTKLGQASETVQIVEGKNGKKYRVSIKAEPVPPCKRASRKKCERELRAAMQQPTPVEHEVRKHGHKGRPAADEPEKVEHSGHKSSHRAAGPSHSKRAHHEAHKETVSSGRHVRAEPPEPRRRSAPHHKKHH